MRMWHIDSLPYLPRMQLKGQWKEVSTIKGKIAKAGTPNHSLVNKVMKAPLAEFKNYVKLLRNVLIRENIPFSEKLYQEIMDWECDLFPDNGQTYYDYWHNFDYVRQYYYNLEEKYQCDAIPEDEFIKFRNWYWEKLSENIEQYTRKEVV